MVWGGTYRLVNYVDNSMVSIERCSLNSDSNANDWWYLVSLEYNVDTMHCNIYVDQTDICAEIHENINRNW